MCYVVRHTYTPEYDTRRLWSAWIGLHGETKISLLEDVFEYTPISRGVVNACGVDYYLVESGYVTDLNELYRESDIDPRDEFNRLVVEAVEDEGELDLRLNEAWGRWQLCHHEGLACWLLDAEDEAEAIAEATAHQESFEWAGFGYSTRGTVRHVAQINETLHLFWCDEVDGEV
jgi:hypothetical protein